MKKAAIFSLILCFLTPIFAQNDDIKKDPRSPERVQEIIKHFMAKEALFREALKSYVFNREATIQEIGLGGGISGVYRRDSFMTFNEDGSRFEKVLFAPIPTLPSLQITPE